MKSFPPADTLSMKSGGLCGERVWAWSVKDVMEQAESRGGGQGAGGQNALLGGATELPELFSVSTLGIMT